MAQEQHYLKQGCLPSATSCKCISAISSPLPGEKKTKKPLSKARNLDLRSTAGRDYIYNSLFTEEWGVIFGLISAFWTQSLFLPQRCKAVKNQSSCSVLPQSWQPPWATNFLVEGFEGITWNAFHCAPKSRAASLGEPSWQSALSLPALPPSLFPPSPGWAELCKVRAGNSLLGCQERPWDREIWSANPDIGWVWQLSSDWDTNQE